MVSRDQLEQREEDDAVESADIHDENGGQPSLTAIQQVGNDRASTLREAGFESVKDVATASQNALTEAEGIGGARGEAIAESANGLLDGESSGTVDDAPADVAEDGDTHVGAGEVASETDRESDGEQASVVANARASLAEIARRVYGHTRMLFDRRALDPRAYGATDDWTALTFDCSDLDADSDPVRELLEETVYIGEVPVEITGKATDRLERRLSAESSVRVPREGIEQVERAAQDDNPEAKRTVTLLRRALRAEEERAIRGSGG
ncbi:helix-hairpin-helix domain-containing protein [Halococcus sp. AFM35]|uniref:helix-hairpin-helix domain-containing protein n=1 Tax=Halococcus sp. AFM35 TaxID=3421653 RepID=UPI003EBD8F04